METVERDVEKAAYSSPGTLVFLRGGKRDDEMPPAPCGPPQEIPNIMPLRSGMKIHHLTIYPPKGRSEILP